ncbi:MAG: hypothetical protein HYV09_33235 [Deltaproteobacteria bacterium]|nr:hypothetical protein [Deltaproteobacteria bacterium]
MKRPLAVSFAVVVVLAPLALTFACTSTPRGSAAATRPTSPADGAADYKYNPGGPHEKPIVPVPSGEPTAPAGVEITDCPPKCNPDGSWSGCGLKKPRGAACQGCTPKCKGKGTPDEGWYDCNGVLIAQRRCGA